MLKYIDQKTFLIMVKKIDEVIIKWPNGAKQELKDFQVNAIIKLDMTKIY